LTLFESNDSATQAYYLQPLLALPQLATSIDVTDIADARENKPAAAAQDNINIVRTHEKQPAAMQHTYLKMGRMDFKASPGPKYEVKWIEVSSPGSMTTKRLMPLTVSGPQKLLSVTIIQADGLQHVVLRNPGPETVTIPQCLFNKIKQHTLFKC